MGACVDGTFIFEKKPRLGVGTGAGAADGKPEVGGKAGRGVAHAVTSATQSKLIVSDGRFIKSLFNQ